MYDYNKSKNGLPESKASYIVRTIYHPDGRIEKIIDDTRTIYHPNGRIEKITEFNLPDLTYL
jgi:hypothetical protein